MAAEVLAGLIFPALLILAAGWDLTGFVIPNAIPLALVVFFLLFVPAAGLPLPAAGAHGLAGLCALAVTFGMFALGWIGGGDAKLFSAAALWFGFHDLLAYALIASVVGGGLTLLLIAFRRLPLPAALFRYAWIARLHDAEAGIPYGVALAAGALVVLPEAEILRLALGG
jgi:prepilin peptidase CpaA